MLVEALRETMEEAIVLRPGLW